MLANLIVFNVTMLAQTETKPTRIKVKSIRGSAVATFQFEGKTAQAISMIKSNKLVPDGFECIGKGNYPTNGFYLVYTKKETL